MSSLDYYRQYLDNWKPDAGPKPTIAEIEAVHETGVVRPGTKDALAIAMATRKDGTTQPQIKAILGGTHRNKITQMITEGVAQRIPAPHQGRHTVYKIKLNKGAKKPMKAKRAKADLEAKPDGATQPEA